MKPRPPVMSIRGPSLFPFFRHQFIPLWGRSSQAHLFSYPFFQYNHDRPKYSAVMHAYDRHQALKNAPYAAAPFVLVNDMKTGAARKPFHLPVAQEMQMYLLDRVAFPEPAQEIFRPRTREVIQSPNAGMRLLRRETVRESEIEFPSGLESAA